MKSELLEIWWSKSSCIAISELKDTKKEIFLLFFFVESIVEIHRTKFYQAVSIRREGSEWNKGLPFRVHDVSWVNRSWRENWIETDPSVSVIGFGHSRSRNKHSVFLARYQWKDRNETNDCRINYAILILVGASCREEGLEVFEKRSPRLPACTNSTLFDMNCSFFRNVCISRKKIEDLCLVNFFPNWLIYPANYWISFLMFMKDFYEND